jgi:nucleoside-diphosphate-sugar epimerase
MAERVLSLHGRYGVRATVVRAATFFGPGVAKSSVSQTAVAGALAGKIVHVPGDPGMVHAFTYVPDFAATMIEAGSRDAAFGHCWHTPSHNGRSHLDFLRQVAKPAGHEPRLRALGGVAMRCLGLFNPALDELHDMLYLYESPWAFSSALTQRTFGIASTPLAAALGQTTAALRVRQPAPSPTL